jgi:hypothetical protein
MVDRKKHPLSIIGVPATRLPVLDAIRASAELIMCLTIPDVCRGKPDYAVRPGEYFLTVCFGSRLVTGS